MTMLKNLQERQELDMVFVLCFDIVSDQSTSIFVETFTTPSAPRSLATDKR